MLPFCAACLLQIFLGSDPVWGLTFYLQASMQNDKKAGDPSTNMDGSPTICQYYLGCISFTSGEKCSDRISKLPSVTVSRSAA